MNHISLLPDEYKNKKKSSRKLGISTIAMGIISGVLVFAYIIIRILITIPESEMKVLKAESDMLQIEIEERMPLETLSNDVKRLTSLLREAIDNQPHWVGIFTSMGKELPKSVQITGITGEYKDNISYLDIKGTAFRHEDVALWMERIKENTAYIDAQLDYSQRMTSNNTDIIQFELHITYQQEEPFQLFEEAEE